MKRDEYDIFEPIAPNPVVIDWAPGNTCNFSCDYCHPTINDGSFSWQKFTDAKRFLDFIWESVCLPNNQKLLINLQGGEPTLWPALTEFCTYVKQLDTENSIRLLTNGTRDTNWWIQRNDIIDSAIVSIHNGQSKKERISEKFWAVQEAGINISMHVMIDVNYFDDCIETYEYLYKHNTNSELLFKPLRINIGSETLQPYSDNQKIQLNQLPSRSHPSNIMYNLPMQWRLGDNIKLVNDIERDLILTHENNWQDWYCNVGIETFVVNHEGYIKGGSFCFQHLNYGHITDEQYKLPLLPIKCKYNGCYCLTDLQTTKRKHLDPGQEYIDANISSSTYKITT